MMMLASAIALAAPAVGEEKPGHKLLFADIPEDPMCWTTSETDCEDAVTVYKDGTVVIPGLTYTPNLRMGRDNKYGIPIPGLPPTMPPTAVGTVAAIGVNNTVVARASTAIGNENFAIGWASLATGYKTSSVGEFATSSGVSTVAEGVASVSMGYNTKAQSFAEAPPPPVVQRSRVLQQ